MRRLLTIALAVLLTTAATGARPAPASAADLSTGEAEVEMIRLLNAERARYGLLEIRVDPRLMALAGQRSTSMANLHYFSHVQPDGRSVFDLLRAARISTMAAGEIIAANTTGTVAESVRVARDGWMSSAGHRAVVLSTRYSYFGLGFAIDPVSGARLWTGVFIMGPDRTGGWAMIGAGPAPTLPVTDRYRHVSLAWTGGDVQLVTMTSGFRLFQLRVRTDGGAWATWSAGTTQTTRALRIWRGHTYDVQVRACDQAANCGAWATQPLSG